MDNSDTWCTTSASQTAEIGKKISADLAPSESGAVVLCLWGELGSGKTTFAQGFAKGLGTNQRILSPTFIIVRRYNIEQKFLTMYHLDLYQTKSEPEIVEVGFTEMIADPSAIMLIEWPERLGSLLPKHRLDLHFSTEIDDSHFIALNRL